MFSPRRIGKVFLALLILSPFYVGCSKAKSSLDDSSTLSSDNSDCLTSAEGCDYDFTSTGSGTGTGTSTGTGTGTGSGTGGGLSSSLTNPNLNNSDLIGTPSGTVSAQQQTSCYSNLGYQYGLNNTGSNYAQNFNQSSWFNQNSGTGNSTASNCLATNMSQSTAANLGVATYTQQNNCTTTAYQVLKALTGNSTTPNMMARRISVMAYARCMLDLTQQQTNAVQWTQNNLTSYGYIQYYLSQFIQLLSQTSWY